MKNTYAFDIDGVLCIFRYCGEKVALKESDWIMECMRGKDTYKDAKPVKKFMDFVKEMIKENAENAEDFFVCSAASGRNEGINRDLAKACI